MKDHIALVLRKGTQTLFIQRSLQKKKLPGVWAFASGTVEDGETPEQTATREAQEELGITVEPVKVLAVCELSEMETTLHFVLCDLKEGEPTIMAPEEIEQFLWMSFSEFFEKFDDIQIGHGLVWLRAHPEVWQDESL